MYPDYEQLPSLSRRFTELKQAGDLEGMRALLRDHPEIVQNVDNSGSLLFFAAMMGRTEVVALLAEAGMDVNTPFAATDPDRPIKTAAMGGHPETVRWLLEHGAEVNYSPWPEQQPYCLPLPSVIIDGNLEIVRLLVEAGAKLDVLDRRKMTPLTWAIQYGQKEIADYLRSKGGVEAGQLPGGFVPPPPTPLNPLREYVRSRLGYSTQPLDWGPPGPFSPQVFSDYERCCVLTQGMSARPMPVPPGGERYRRAELVVWLSEGWAEIDPKFWKEEPELAWPAEWLLRLAAYPFVNDTWLGGEYLIVSNEEPPQPLSPFTEMTCWLLLADTPPLERVELPDGDSVVFYTLMPIHTAERDYEKEHGLRALLERFAEAGVADALDPRRPSAV